jgi:hypothetical protein
MTMGALAPILFLMPRKIRDALDAQACLDAAKAAGLAPRDWARQHDLDARSLHVWRIHLARRASRDSAPPSSGPRLVELVPTPPSRPPSRFVLHVAGAVVELDDNFREESLARLVRVLRAC